MSCSDHDSVTTRFCPDCGTNVNPDPIRVDNVLQLKDVAKILGVSSDWHEPDEQKVTAKVFGRSFDNAGFWPHDPGNPYLTIQDPDSEALEMYVELRKAGKVIAHVNLATLFAMACRTHG